jgi:hypothetical protein
MPSKATDAPPPAAPATRISVPRGGWARVNAQGGNGQTASLSRRLVTHPPRANRQRRGAGLRQIEGSSARRGGGSEPEQPSWHGCWTDPCPKPSRARQGVDGQRESREGRLLGGSSESDRYDDGRATINRMRKPTGFCVIRSGGPETLAGTAVGGQDRWHA